MSTADTINNQRSSFRCPVTESRQNCTLQVGGDQYAGRLLDESVGGFSVLLEKNPNLEIKQTTLLQTDSGLFNVRVMYLAEASPPIGSRLLETDVPTQWFRLGLERVGDVLPLEEPTVSKFAWKFGLRKRDMPRSKGWFPATGIFLTFAVVAIPLGMIGLFWYSRQEKIDISTQWKDPWESWGGKNGAKPERLPASQPMLKVPTADERSPFDSPTEGFSAGNHSNLNNETKVRNLIRRFPGPPALILPEVIKLLSLTDEQQERIRQLADTMAEDIRKLFRDPQLRGDREAITDRRESLLEEYLRRALELLTPEQRVEWDKLHDQPPTE